MAYKSWNPYHHGVCREDCSLNSLLSSLGLIVFPFPFNLIPFVDRIYWICWEWIVQRVGNDLLGLSNVLEYTASGSGDRLFDWIWYLSIILISVIVSSIWALVDRKRRSYELLNGWLLIFLTFYLADSLLFYGLMKVVAHQFSPPDLERLFQTFGESSPMRLMWTFMGHSRTYSVFGGALEAIAGLLLVV